MNLADSPAADLTPLALAPGQRLPIARYRFQFRLEDDLRLPDFAGSLLRGQFGAALRRTACMTGARTCGGCPLLRTCPYPAIFDSPPAATRDLHELNNAPNPYVIEPPPLGTRCIGAGERFDFGLVLVGRALEQLPLIVHSWRRAFHHGLGAERTGGELGDLCWEGDAGVVSVWDRELEQIASHRPALQMPTFDSCDCVRLDITMPLRLQSNGRPLAADELSPRKLITALIRRTALLFELHAATPGLGEQARALASHAEQLSDERELRWHDWTRYSSRQKQLMTLGGVIGTWTLRGELAPLLPWLWLGQWLHAGKNATMGMGAYRLRF